MTRDCRRKYRSRVLLATLPLAVREVEGKQMSACLPCLVTFQPRILVLQSLQHIHGHVFISKPDFKKCPSSFVHHGEDQGVKPVGVLQLGGQAVPVRSLRVWKGGNVNFNQVWSNTWVALRQYFPCDVILCDVFCVAYFVSVMCNPICVSTAAVTSLTHDLLLSESSSG